MIEWLNTHIAYWHWITAGLLIATFELLVPTFVLLFLGIAAILTGLLTALLPIDFPAQLFIWAVLSGLLLFLWHKYISPRMQNRTLAGLSREAIVGQIGTVLFFSEAEGRGQLRFPAPILGTDEWEFIFTGSLNSGDKVQISDISGNSLIVTKRD